MHVCVCANRLEFYRELLLLQDFSDHNGTTVGNFSLFTSFFFLDCSSIAMFIVSCCSRTYSLYHITFALCISLSVTQNFEKAPQRTGRTPRALSAAPGAPPNVPVLGNGAFGAKPGGSQPAAPHFRSRGLVYFFFLR